MALTQVSSDGIKNLNVKTADLENSGVTAGTYGSASLIPALVIDAKGRVTSASTNAISTDLVNDTSPQLGGDLDTNSFEILLDDLHAVKFGDSADLSIFHQSGFNQIQSNNTSPIQLRDTNNVMLRANPSGSVDLRHNGSAKFETTSTGVSVTGKATFPDGNTSGVVIGDGGDFRLFHNGSHSYIENDTGNFVLDNSNGVDMYVNSGNDIYIRPQGSENGIKVIGNAGVELYFNGTRKAYTSSDGFRLDDNLRLDDSKQIRLGNSEDLKIHHTSNKNYINAQNYNLALQRGGTTSLELDGNGDIYIPDNKTTYWGNSADLRLYHNGSHSYLMNHTGIFHIGCVANTGIIFMTNNGERWNIDSSGHLNPKANNAYDIGNSSYRVRNIYTNDLNLSNEGSSNDVDGTSGSFTIQEGAEDLFLINRRNGKKYKFNLTEVS